MIVKKNIMLKHNHHHQIPFTICSSECYNSGISAMQRKLSQWFKGQDEPN